MEFFGEAMIVQLRHLDFGALPRGGGCGHIEHHRHQFLDLVDVEFHHRVDHFAIERQQRLELQRETFVDLAHFGFEAGPDFLFEDHVFDVVLAGAWR